MSQASPRSPSSGAQHRVMRPRKMHSEDMMPSSSPSPLRLLNEGLSESERRRRVQRHGSGSLSNSEQGDERPLRRSVSNVQEKGGVEGAPSSPTPSSLALHHHPLQHKEELSLKLSLRDLSSPPTNPRLHLVGSSRSQGDGPNSERPLSERPRSERPRSESGSSPLFGGEGLLTARLSGTRRLQERIVAQIWDGPVGTAPVAIGMAGSIRSFLKSLDVAGACCLGALVGAQSGPADFFKPHIHYSLLKQAYMVPLPNAYLPNMDHVEQLNPHVAAISLPPNTLGDEATGSPVVDAFLRDIPALQGFIKRFMTDPNFVPPEARWRSKNPVTPEEYLKTSHYMVDIHREGIGFNLYLRRPIPRNVNPPPPPAPKWPSYGRQIKPKPVVQKPENIIDQYLLKPSFCGGTELLCQVAFQSPYAKDRVTRVTVKGGRREIETGEKEPPAHEILGVMTRKTAIPLSCTSEDVISLVHSNLDQIIAPPENLTCFEAIIMSLCGLPQVREGDEEGDGEGGIWPRDGKGTGNPDTSRTESNAPSPRPPTSSDEGPAAQLLQLGLGEPSLSFVNNIMLQRLIQSRTFCRLMWRAIRRKGAVEPETDLEAWHLRCLLLPSEFKLLNAVARNTPELDANLLVEEFKGLAVALQVFPSARLAVLEGLLTTLWEEFDADPSNEPLIEIVRALIKSVPIFAESCVEAGGVAKAASIWWKAREEGETMSMVEGGHTLHKLVKAAFDLKGSMGRRSSGSAYSGDYAEIDQLEFVSAFDLPALSNEEQQNVEGEDTNRGGPGLDSSDEDSQPEEQAVGNITDRGGNGPVVLTIRVQQEGGGEEEGPPPRSGRLPSIGGVHTNNTSSDPLRSNAALPTTPQQQLATEAAGAAAATAAPPEVPAATAAGETAGSSSSSLPQGGDMVAKQVYASKKVYPVKPLRRLSQGGSFTLLGGASSSGSSGVPTTGGLLALAKASSAKVLPGLPNMTDLKLAGKLMLPAHGSARGSDQQSARTRSSTTMGSTSRSSLSEDTELAKADTPVGRGSIGSEAPSTARDHGTPPTGRAEHSLLAAAREQPQQQPGAALATASGDHGSLPSTARDPGLPPTARGDHSPTTARGDRHAPNTARSVGPPPSPGTKASGEALKVPKLTIKPIKELQQQQQPQQQPKQQSSSDEPPVSGHAPSSAATSGRGGGSTLYASPLFTTRSSRRYASRSSAGQLGFSHQRGRSSSSAFINTGIPVTVARGSILSSRLALDQTINKLRSTTVMTVDEPVDLTQVKFHMLAKKVGQTYVASDLWAIMETQRRSSEASSSSSSSSAHKSLIHPSQRQPRSFSSPAETAAMLSHSMHLALDNGDSSPSSAAKKSVINTIMEGSSITRDKRTAVVLEPYLAFWLPEVDSALHWATGQGDVKKLLRIGYAGGGGGADDSEDQDIVMSTKEKRTSIKKEDSGEPSPNLKLLRDMCFHLPQHLSTSAMAELEDVAVILVDELLSGLRAGYDHTHKPRMEVLESMYDVVFKQSTVLSGGETNGLTDAGDHKEVGAAATPTATSTENQPQPDSAAPTPRSSSLKRESDGAGGHKLLMPAVDGRGTGGEESESRNGGFTVRWTDEPIVAHIELRMLKLWDLQNGPAALPALKNYDANSEVSMEVRARLSLVQRWAASDRLALAKLLYKHIRKAVTQSRMSWTLITRVVGLCRKVVVGLKISDPRQRERFSQSGSALVLEEAGFMYWIIRTVDLLCDVCCRSPTNSIKLLEILHDYIDTVREPLNTILFHLSFLPRLDSVICTSFGNKSNPSKKDRAFCTPMAFARIRLATISHINRCIDLCRSAMRWHSRWDSTDGNITGNEAKARLQQIVSDFHKLNIYLNADFMHKMASAVTVENSRRHNSFRSLSGLTDQKPPEDPRLLIGVVWALGRVVSMEDERHLQRREWVDQIIFQHFTAVIKLYAAAWDPHKRLLCKLSLRVLLSLVLYRHPTVLAKFFQLRVLHFFVHEISSEMLCGGPMAAASSSAPPAPPAAAAQGTGTAAAAAPSPSVPPSEATFLSSSRDSEGLKNLGGNGFKLAAMQPRVGHQANLTLKPLTAHHPLPPSKLNFAAPLGSITTDNNKASLDQPPPRLSLLVSPPTTSAHLSASLPAASSLEGMKAAAPVPHDSKPGSSEVVAAASPAPALKVDDRVDGLVTLKSGKQRWFPGRISSVSEGHDDGMTRDSTATYTVTYDDGDVETGKAAADVRLSRSQQRAPEGDKSMVHRRSQSERTMRVSDHCDGGGVNSSPTKAKVPSVPLAKLEDPKQVTVEAPKTEDQGPRRHSADEEGAQGLAEAPREKKKKPLFLDLKVAIPPGKHEQPPLGPPHPDVFSPSAAPSPNPVNSPATSLVQHELDKALEGATRLQNDVDGGDDDSYDDDDHHDDDSEAEDDEIFDIPSTLPGVRPALQSMKLAFPVAGFGMTRETAGQLGNSLSASLLYSDADAVAPPPSLPTTGSGTGTMGPGDTPEGGRLSTTAVASARGSSDQQEQPQPTAEQLQQQARYAEQRKKIALYSDPQLQELVLLLVLNLCVSADRVTLDSRYCNQFPASSSSNSAESMGFNVLYALFCHLGHPDNSHIVPRLRSHAGQFGKAIVRLLRLVCEGIFDPRLYAHGKQTLAKGAFGTVMSVKSPVNLLGDRSGQDSDRNVSHCDSTLTVKMIPHEVSPQDRCVTFDVFSEVTALDMLSQSPSVCHLYDYGISGNKFWLVMERCRSSLKTWRTEHMPTVPSDKDFVLYLHVFSKVVECVQTMHDQSIAHFDLKCDNIFIRDNEPLDAADRAFQLPFDICVGDFGEAQIGKSRSNDVELDEEEEEEEGADRRILQGRGTEAIQSPEMLLIGAKNRKDAAGYDRRKRVTVGCASDVWSLGCLLYELLTGEFLFVYTVWAEFFVQLTSANTRVLPPERMAVLRTALSPEVYSMAERLLEYMLVRSADRRPRIDMVQRQLQLVVQAITKKVGLPPEQQPFRPRLHLPGDGSSSSRATTGEDISSASPVKSDGLDDSSAMVRAAEKIWIPPKSVGEESEGLWRMSADLYIGSVAKWDSFIHTNYNFHDLMSEAESNDANSHVPIKSDDPAMFFNASFLPDLWNERQWLPTQRVPAYHKGITRALFVTEAISSFHHAGAPPISLVEKSLKDIEVMISLQKNIRLAVTTPTSVSSTLASTGPLGASHQSLSSARSSRTSFGNSLRQYQMDKQQQQQGGSPVVSAHTQVFVLQVNSRMDGTTTHESVAKLLQENPSVLDKATDFVLAKDQKNHGCAVIVTSATDQTASLSHVVASTVAALCIMRAPDAPMSLYETLLHAKEAYPRMALTPHFVEFLQQAFQKAQTQRQFRYSSVFNSSIFSGSSPASAAAVLAGAPNNQPHDENGGGSSPRRKRIS